MSDYFIKADYVDTKVKAILISRDDNDVRPQDISAVFGVIYFADSDGKFYLLTTKNERGIDIPGGHIEPTDKSVFNALSREIKEETNEEINPRAIKPFVIADLLSKKEYYGNKILWFGMVNIGVERKNLDKLKWVSFEEFLENYSQIEYKGLMTWILKNVKK